MAEGPITLYPRHDEARLTGVLEESGGTIAGVEVKAGATVGLRAKYP